MELEKQKVVSGVIVDKIHLEIIVITTTLRY